MSLHKGFKVLLGLLLLFSVSSCLLTDDEKNAIDNGFNPPDYQPPVVDRPDPKAFCYEHQEYQPPAQVTKKIDILFVVDSSGSLNEERDAIGDGVDAFVAELPADADVRIAVMPAHATTWAGRLYRPSSTTPFVLDNQAMAMADIRAALRTRMRNVATETITDGGEAGIYSLDRAMEPTQLAESRAQGFFRSDAALAVVFVADENDICARYPVGVVPVPDPNFKEGPAFNLYCQYVTPENTYTRLRGFQGDRPLLVSGVVYHEGSVFPHTGENEIAYGYLEMIRAANGLAVDLAGGHVHEGLAQIGTLVTKKLSLKTEFTLDDHGGEIDPASVGVEVDAAQVPFVYVSEVKEVHLTSHAGRENSEVYISYCLKPDDSEEIPVKITRLQIVDITSTTAAVTWDTDLYSTSQVETTDTFRGWVYTGAVYPDLVVRHRVELTGLVPDTVYSVRVFSGVEGTPSVSHPISFRTRR